MAVVVVTEGDQNEGDVGDPLIGVVPVSEVLPLLTEHVSEQQITHLSLLGKLSREEVMEDYAVGEGKIPATLLSDGKLAHVSRQKIERALQA